MKCTRPKQFNMFLAYPTYRGDSDIFCKEIKRYLNIGTEILAYLIDWEKMDGLPKCRLYNPADHELFIDTAHFMGIVKDDDIVKVNCDLIERCDLVILFGSGKTILKGQLLEEITHAKKNKIPIFTMPDLSPVVMDTLKLAIHIIVKSGDIHEMD